MKLDYSVHLPSPGYTLHLSRTISQILIEGVGGQQVVAVTHSKCRKDAGWRRRAECRRATDARPWLCRGSLLCNYGSRDMINVMHQKKEHTRGGAEEARSGARQTQGGARQMRGGAELTHETDADRHTRDASQCSLDMTAILWLLLHEVLHETSSYA